MKIWTSKYRNHWVSPYQILTRICFWEKDEDRIYNLKDDPANPYEPWVKVLEPVCQALQWFLDRIHPRIEYIKLDPWDTWSFDHTLADIILPGLQQLKETKHGAPYTDDEDVPEYLRSHMAQPKENEWDTDSLYFMRWDWILAEMIWAFEQKVDDEADNKFFDHSECKPGRKPWDSEEFKKVKYDEAGHKVWLERKRNGFRLFGKYFEALWD
jgi:hypothetical protein